MCKILRGQSGAWQGYVCCLNAHIKSNQRYLAELVENEFNSEHLEEIVASFWMIKFVASWVSVKGAGTGSNVTQLFY